MKYVVQIIIFFLTWVIYGCSHKITQSPTAENILVFPAPPNEPRVQFLTYINTSEDVEKPASAIKTFFTGRNIPKPILRPYGIATSEGKLFICDSKINGLEVIDIKSGEFKYFIPTGMGELRMPLNCFVDSIHNLYVADSYRRQVVIYDDNLKFIGSIGRKEKFKPIDVFVDDENIYVANLEGNSIDIFKKSSLGYEKSIPDFSSGDEGYLYKPTSVFIDNNRIYVTDFGEAKIKIYNKEGDYIGAIGSYGRGLGQFVRPKEINIDNDGNLYVVDAAFENVQMFTESGKLLMYFGRPSNMSLPAGIGISYHNLEVFKDYVYRDFELKFLIFVSNQFGPNKIGVYGFVEEKTKESDLER
ncbi:MAG: 6-bladed beta-propeller [Chlorobi bacterium]|nr:6-bladed beta-propeller [Chlorobiota bacterium]